jgi:uncharacterized protein YbjT (DUF2867 family)
MAAIRNILLIGSTGTIGSAIRKALVARKDKFGRLGALTTQASLNDAKKKVVFEGFRHDGIEIVVADLDDQASLVKALKGE